MLEIIVIAFERSERDIKSDRDIGFQDCALGEHLEDSHVLSIQILSFLSDPTERQLTLHFVGNLYLSLSAHGQHFIVAKIDNIVVDVDQLVVVSFEEQFFLEDVGMLPDL